MVNRGKETAGSKWGTDYLIGPQPVMCRSSYSKPRIGLQQVNRTIPAYQMEHAVGQSMYKNVENVLIVCSVAVQS